MRIVRHGLYVFCVAVFVSAGALGAVGAPADPASKKSSMTAEERKARSKECSAQADKQGLHGKERQKFRSKCKREGKA